MSRTATKQVSLKDVFEEVRALRREIALFVPAESLEGYAHPERIVASYKKAAAKHPTHARRQNAGI